MSVTISDETLKYLNGLLKQMSDESMQLVTTAQQLLSDMQHFSGSFNGMDTGQVFKLSVPWIGQNTSASTDDYSNSDCGPACVAMWLNFIGKNVTVDDVSIATGLPRGYHYTIPGNLITAAAHYGLMLERVTGFTLESIAAEIAKAVPCIVLVHYGSLPTRNDPNFTAGHYLLIVGYQDGVYYYHDPYWPDDRGAFLSMTAAQLSKAMQDCSLDGNTPNQGLRSRAL